MQDSGGVPECRSGTAGWILSCCREAEIVGTAAPAPTWLPGACRGLMESGSGSESSHKAASQDSAWFHSHGGDSQNCGAVTRKEQSHLCASPGGRSLQWGCLCCHHVQSKMKRGLNWLLGAQLSAPSIRRTGQSPQISTSLSLSLSWSPS